MAGNRKVKEMNNMAAGVQNYNLEDTGRLMTMSSRGSRNRKIALIAVSAVLVAAIAVAGFILTGNRRYDHQLEIADKAFAEGNYELAEAEYLKAVRINKRKPKAREGLAYTYAVQGKKQESIDTYEKLKKDFGDQKYTDAAEEVRNDELPSNIDLIPAKGLWRNFASEDLPYGEELRRYIWGLHFDYFDIESARTFDCNEPSGFPALYMLMENPNLYSCSIEARMESHSGDVAPEMGWTVEWGGNYDPREWGRLHEVDGENVWGGYSSIDTAKADEMVKAVFNVGDDIIAEDLSRGEKEKYLYEEDGRYYYVYGPNGAEDVSDYVFEFGDAWTDGQKYCLKYEAGVPGYEFEEDRIDLGMEHCTYYIIFEPKLIDGEHYWSLYYLGTEMPQDVTEGLAYTYGDGGVEPDEGGKNIESAYQPVIDEYKQVLEEAANGKEYDIFGSGNPNGFTYVFAEMIPHEGNSYRTPQYAMKDINGDGVTEMLVGVWFEDRSYVGSILTLDKSGKPVVVINCGSFMYRADLDVYDDGTIMNGGSSGADSNRFEFYKLEGTGLITVDQFRMENGEGAHNGAVMSEEKYFDEVEQARSKDLMKLDWKSF